MYVYFWYNLKLLLNHIEIVILIYVVLFRIQFLNYFKNFYNVVYLDVDNISIEMCNTLHEAPYLYGAHDNSRLE